MAPLRYFAGQSVSTVYFKMTLINYSMRNQSLVVVFILPLCRRLRVGFAKIDCPLIKQQRTATGWNELIVPSANLFPNTYPNFAQHMRQMFK